MSRHCKVCRKTEPKNPEVTFHSFPRNPEKRNIWFKLLGFEQDRVLPKTSFICSDHFEKKDFQYKRNGSKYLKIDSTPRPLQHEIFKSQLLSFDPDSDSNENSTLGNITLKRRMTLSEISFKDLMTSSPEGSGGSTFTKSNRKDPSSHRLVTKETLNVAKDEYSSQGSSTTITASESEYEIASTIKGQPNDAPHDIVGPSVGPETVIRGNLGLISVLKTKKRKRYVGDMSSSDFGTPEKRSKNLLKVKEKVRRQANKIKILQTIVRRLRLKINSLNGLIKLLRERALISETSESAIRASLAGPSLDIFERMLKGSKCQKYNPSLRCFALTLAFYSPKAYDFVRQTFNMSLPHLGTLSRWYKSVDGSPGFTQEALVALKVKCEEKKPQKILCNLVMDEISIRKMIEWTGTKFTGYVDVGIKLEPDILPEARESLVFMLVALNASWKIPVGYFLLNGLTGSEKASLVKKCLEFIHESGVVITSLTCDGAAANVSMMEHLGADFTKHDNLKTYFMHPVTAEKVYLFLDACHMIKLIRNCLGVFQLENGKGQPIKWEYISKLVEVQNKEGLHAATKIKLRHLEWQREKMEVRLATQVLSKSVSDALKYLCVELKMEEFKDALPTADFIIKINNIFDILNSRNYFGKYFFKRPLSTATSNQMNSFMDELSSYIIGLKINNTPILESKRKTGFLGILVCMESLREIYRSYVEEKELLKYILTYKLSQDHLELFFGAIRSKGGYNNNPSARQFEAAYKRLLIHSEITGPNSGNSINLEKITILCCCTGAQKLSTTDGQNLQESEGYKSFQAQVLKQINEQEFITSSTCNLLTDYVEDIVSYIAGFVVKGIKKCVTCTKCLNLIESDISLSHLQRIKTYEALHRASTLAVDVCQAAEKLFRFFLKTNDLFSHNKNLLLTLITNTLNFLPVSVYDYFGDHLFDGDPVDGHTRELLKLILRNYFNLRIYHETITKQDTLVKGRVRSINTKAILFKNQ